jgi:hypothetical protein
MGPGGYGDDYDDSGGYGSSGYPGYGSDMPGANAGETEDDPEVTEARRRLKLPLHCVLLGLRGESVRSSSTRTDEAAATLGGIGQLAQGPDRTKVDDIIAALEAIIEATDKKDEGLEELMKEVRTKTLGLENLLPKPEPTEEEEAVMDEPGGGDLPGGAPAAEAGKDEPGKEGPGKDEPGKDEPGKEGPGKDEPGKDEPGKDGPGQDEPGN